MLMTVEDLDDLEDYDEDQQILIKEAYNSPQFKQAQQAFDEFVEKRKPLLLQLVDNVEEEYNEIIYYYNEKFFNKFDDLQLGMSNIENNGLNLPMSIFDEYVEEDNINDIEDEDISDEQYDIFMEKMEDVFTDINNIHSNISDIEGNLNYHFSSELEIKEEIFSLLKEIEEKTDTMAYKIMKLVNYME
jgi:hypothetical protein